MPRLAPMQGSIAGGLRFLFALASIVAAQIPQGVHPAYDVVNLRPMDFRPSGITGMDFLADGSLAICTWGGYERKEGEVLVLSGVDGSGPESVKVRKIADGLDEPMGLKVLDGKIYVMQRTELSSFALPSGEALAVPVQVVGGWHPPAGDWTYGLVQKDGSFYATQGGWNPKDPALGPDQNSWLKLTPGHGYQTLAGGLRNADGIGTGPDGEMFATDNQGNWLPSSKLIHLVPGRFYGCRNNPHNPFASVQESPPAVWIPHGDIGFSPTQPILVPAGTYQGQMLAGDIHFGGIQRYFLEKVKDSTGSPEYQGAVFRFTGGLECGVHRLLFDQAGTLYMGGAGGNSDLGDLGGWNWNNKWYGLQKLVPNGKTAFDLLAVRSLADGFELEFTRPAVDAGLASKYTAEHWRYLPKADYGGPKVGKAALVIASASVSQDGKRVHLKIDGLKPGFIVHLKISGLKSIADEELWANEAWYTLNNLGPAESATRLEPSPAPSLHSSPGKIRVLAGADGRIGFEIRAAGSFTLDIRNAAGRRMSEIHGHSSGAYFWKNPAGRPTLYTFRLSESDHTTQYGRFLAF